METDQTVFGAPRAVLLAAVVLGALAAVLLPGEKESSFAAGVAVGAGLSFVVSFLRNPRRLPSRASSEGESGGNDEDTDRRG